MRFKKSWWWWWWWWWWRRWQWWRWWIQLYIKVKPKTNGDPSGHNFSSSNWLVILVTTCVSFQWVWSSSYNYLHRSWSKLFIISIFWPCTQPNSKQVDLLYYFLLYQCCMQPYIRTFFFWALYLACIDVHCKSVNASLHYFVYWFMSLYGQGFIVTNSCSSQKHFPLNGEEYKVQWGKVLARNSKQGMLRHISHGHFKRLGICL